MTKKEVLKRSVRLWDAVANNPDVFDGWDDSERIEKELEFLKSLRPKETK